MIFMWSTLVHTLCHLRPTQLLYQVWYRVYRPAFREETPPQTPRSLILVSPIAKPACRQGNTFRFLNLTAPFRSWNDTQQGMLWVYNLNYMDGLCTADVEPEEGALWMDRFVREWPENRIGREPYPTALRAINWIKFINRHRDRLASERIKTWEASLYAQCRRLARMPEYHLMGNHLLEDAYALLFAALHFADNRMFRLARRLLTRELKEQILPDGAHFEQSPMYHCILLDRLLDGYNAAMHNRVFDGQEALTATLHDCAVRMLGHLEAMTYADGSIPLLNDAATGIAPTPDELRAYARRLQLTWTPLALGACGYRHLRNAHFEAFADVGTITARYQPGHSHADTFTYELRIDGQPFAVDTGISTYNKTERRQLERSTAAHNTVTADGCGDSSEVWGGFRVGRRAQVTILSENGESIEAVHDGFGRGITHRRRFALTEQAFTVTDTLTKGRTGCSRIHLAPGVKTMLTDGGNILTSHGRIAVEGAENITIDRQARASTAYNRFDPIEVVEIRFRETVTYRIYTS